MRKARVFISCGQSEEREKHIGLEVEKYFKEKGFDTYFAEKVHSPDALTENIFKFLSQSEYFIFIDFKRDKISNDEHRGSLFVNQEIGIATFLKIPSLGFHEKGIKREGIAKFQIHNPFPFEDGTQIINQLKAQTIDWDPDSVDELSIIYNPDNNSRNIILNNHPNKPGTDWWHLTIKNRNKTKHAFSCSAYITKIIDLDNDKMFEIPSLELIWSGLGYHTVNIMANGVRELDAFYVIHGDNKIRFQTRLMTSNIQRFSLPELSNGKYLIEYTIIASNFSMTSKEFILKHEENLEDIEFAYKAD